MIERHLLSEYADSVLTAENDPRVAWNHTANEILLRRLRVIVGAGAVPSEEEVTEAVARMGVLSRIERVQFPDEESAVQARRDVEAGKSFAEIVSEGPGALLEEQWLPWRPTAGELSEQAASLPIGGVSEVFRVGVIDNLIRVVERAPIEAFTVDDGEVARGLQARKSAVRMGELVDELRGRADVRVDDAAIVAITRATIEAILEASSTQHDAQWAIPRLDGAEVPALVAEWQGGSLSPADYVVAVRVMIPALRPSGAFLQRKVRGAVEAEITRRLLLAEARRRRLSGDRWVERSLRKAREEHEVRFAVNRLETLIAVEPTEADSLREFLETVPVPMFRKDDRALVLRYGLPGREAAGVELARIRAAGGGWSRLRELFDGDPGFSGSVQLLSLTPHSLADPALTSAVLDPFGPTLVGPFEMTGRWVVIDRLELEPARAMTDEEIRQAVEERIRQDRSRAARDAWLAARRRERGVIVDPDLLDALSPGG
jgi:hypothetical protein